MRPLVVKSYYVQLADWYSAEPDITLMHYHHDTKHSKRDAARVLNQCTDPLTGWHFQFSACRRNQYLHETLNPQAYKILCSESPDDHGDWVYPQGRRRFIYNECLASEICIDGVTSPGFHPTMNRIANCVSTENYRKIAATIAGKQFGSIQIPANNRGSQLALIADVILTGSSIDTTVFAQSMSLSALTKIPTLSNIPYYGPLPNGVWSCVDCFNIGPEVIPEQTNQLGANVTLASGEAGVMFVTTFLSEQEL